MYNEKLNSLFEKWKKTYSEEEQKKFCEDGLLLKEDTSINVDELWEKSKRRILFLVKDCPDGWGYDLRTLLRVSDDARNLKGQFMQRIAKAFYGLLENQADKRVNDKYVNERMENGEVQKTWNTVPFAMIETKKMAGGKDVSSAELQEALERDKKFLIEEIDILSPNVIVCFDGGKNIFNFVTKEYCAGEEPLKIEDKEYAGGFCLYYYKSKNLAVIQSNHPSYAEEDWAFQERIYSPFNNLLRRTDTL